MGLLAELASVPRPVGSPGLERARGRVVAALEASGYRVRDHHFEFSAFPGVLGAPAIGLVALAILLQACALGAVGWPEVGLAVVGVGGLGLGVFGRWLAREGVLALPWMRRRGTNLVATRGGAEPRVWLVAHLDSKWQPVPTAVRTAGVVVLSLAAVNILVALAFQLVSGANVEYGWRAGAAAAGALPLALSFVGRGGFGAVDNASGVATVLEAAAAVASNPAIGVLITDGEELALAGARAWCRDASPAIALNCDGVDDTGRITVMTVPTSGRLVSAFKDVEPGLRVIRLLPGVLTDSVAFADAGWETVTLSRGGLRTLSRIHTSRDTLDNLSGEGIAPTAVVLANAALEVARWSS